MSAEMLGAREQRWNPNSVSGLLWWFAHDLEEIRSTEGYELGTTMVTRIQAIAELAEQQEIDRDDIMPHDGPDAGGDCYGSYCPDCNCCQHTVRSCDLEGICPNPICSCGNGGVFDD